MDPWYSYLSMTQYAGCTIQLEQTAIDYRYKIHGIMFFANDSKGAFVPKNRIDSLAVRFFGR